MKKLFLLSLIALSGTSALIHAKNDSLLLNSSTQEPYIVVNNKILAKVNGTPITVMDVMKKMDLIFYQQYPQYSSSPQARFQYYQANWKYMLSEMIDKELVLADAKEIKMTVSAGDVRQEMESLFGPNIIENLDKVGMTFTEASQLLESDIMLRRMMYTRAQSKAIAQVTPQVVRKFYDEVAKDLIRDNEWVYSVITIRHKDSQKAAEAAHLINQWLVEEKLPLKELEAKYKSSPPPHKYPPSLNISEEFKTKEKELSDTYKSILVTLTPDTYSAPIVQKSRVDNSTVVRIFYLKTMTPGGVVPYAELEDKIKDKLIAEAVTKETEAYFKRLRQHFNVQEDQIKDVINSDFQPFVLK